MKTCCNHEGQLVCDYIFLQYILKKRPLLKIVIFSHLTAEIEHGMLDSNLQLGSISAKVSPGVFHDLGIKLLIVQWPTMVALGASYKQPKA